MVEIHAMPASWALHALAQSFAYPREGLKDISDGLSALVRRGFCTPNARAALGAIGEFPDDTSAQVEYTRLFIGSFRMEAPPYASYYLDGGLINGPTAAEVEDVYTRFGLELKQSEHCPADHIRYLLSFCALLAQRFEETGLPEFLEAYEDFRETYLASWFPAFQKLVDKYAEHRFYRELAILTCKALA